MLILKGESLDQLQQDSTFLTDLLSEEVEKKTPCKLAIGIGMPQQRLGDLHHSFAEALIKKKSTREEIETSELNKADHTALRNFLETGQLDNFDHFFDESIRSLIEAALRSSLLKHYVILDIVLAVAQFLSDLGGNASQIIPGLRL